MLDRESHSKPIEELLIGFRTDLDRGLSAQEARERLSEMVDGVSLDRAVDAFEMTLDHMLVEAGRRTKLSAIQFTTSGSVPSDAQKAA